MVVDKWTTENTTKLIEMVQSGYRLIDITKTLNLPGTTIRDKLKRIGLKIEKPVRKIKIQQTEDEGPALPVLINKASTEAGGVHFFDLDEKLNCRWPIGELVYCGKPRVENSYYCEKHNTLSVQPEKTK